jgi:hypothetical protein
MAAEKTNQASGVTLSGATPRVVPGSYTQRQTPVPPPVTAGAGRASTLGAPVKAVLARNARETHVTG